MSTIITTTAKEQSISFHIESDETFNWIESTLWGDFDSVIDWQTVIENNHTWDLNTSVSIVHGSQFDKLENPVGVLSTVLLEPGPYEIEWQINASTEQRGLVVLAQSDLSYVPEPGAIYLALWLGIVLVWHAITSLKFFSRGLT